MSDASPPAAAAGQTNFPPFPPVRPPAASTRTELAMESEWILVVAGVAIALVLVLLIVNCRSARYSNAASKSRMVVQQTVYTHRSLLANGADAAA